MDRRVGCVEELGAFIIAYHRMNQFLAALKRGTAKLKADKRVEAFLEEDEALHKTMEQAFARAGAEFLSAEWPRSRPDIWQENQAKLTKAVTAYTERLRTLHVEYDDTQ